MPSVLGIFASAYAGGLPVTANLAGWWDASDSASVTLASGKVSQINDKSGNGRHMVQATATNQPTYASAVRNGLNCMQFSGAQWLTPASTWAQSAITLFIVMQSTDNTSTNLATGWSNYAVDLQNRNANGATPNLTWSVQAKAGGSGTGYFKTLNSGPDTNWNQFDVIRDGTQVDAHINAGSAWVNPTGFTNGTLNALQSPGKLWLGTRNDLAVPLIGYIAEVAIYSTALNATDRTAVRDYLKTKWSTV